nr:hypothetical protein Iba_chr11dCG12090 [Ipomoea batatas]
MENLPNPSARPARALRLKSTSAYGFTSIRVSGKLVLKGSELDAHGHGMTREGVLSDMLRLCPKECVNIYKSSEKSIVGRRALSPLEFKQFSSSHISKMSSNVLEESDKELG